MLTGFQATVIAFVADGEFICAKHIEEQYPEIQDDESLTYWETIGALEEASGYDAWSRYAIEESSGGRGEWCGQCGEELVEQDADYCTEHDGWYAGSVQVDPDGEDSKYCEYEDPKAVEAGANTCRFPDTDPNPPVPRWVPCSVCGAGDGEPHDTSKH